MSISRIQKTLCRMTLPAAFLASLAVLSPEPAQAALEQVCYLTQREVEKLPFPFAQFTTAGSLVIAPVRSNSVERVYKSTKGDSVYSFRKFSVRGPVLEAEGVRSVSFEFIRQARLPKDYGPEKGDTFLAVRVPFTLEAKIFLHLEDSAMIEKGLRYIPYFSLNGELTPMIEPKLTKRSSLIAFIIWKNTLTSMNVMGSLFGKESFGKYYSKTSLKDILKLYQPASIVLFDTLTEEKTEINLTGLLADYAYADAIIDLQGAWRAGTMMANAHVNGDCIGTRPKKN